ncbi:MAG: hypothetical protein FWF24_02975 [Alphaproteobacteria bacterium]|nr:hypothetical protein [Alphaproteobacteria bacterium]
MGYGVKKKLAEELSHAFLQSYAEVAGSYKDIHQLVFCMSSSGSCAMGMSMGERFLADALQYHTPLNFLGCLTSEFSSDLRKLVIFARDLDKEAFKKREAGITKRLENHGSKIHLFLYKPTDSWNGARDVLKSHGVVIENMPSRYAKPWHRAVKKLFV